MGWTTFAGAHRSQGLWAVYFEDRIKSLWAGTAPRSQTCRELTWDSCFFTSCFLKFHQRSCVVFYTLGLQRSILCCKKKKSAYFLPLPPAPKCMNECKASPNDTPYRWIHHHPLCFHRHIFLTKTSSIFSAAMWKAQINVIKLTDRLHRQVEKLCSGAVRCTK